MSGVIGVPSLVMIRILSRLTGMVGVLVVVGISFEGLVAILDSTCAYEFSGMVGYGG